MMQEVMRKVVQRIAEYATAEHGSRHGPVPEKHGVG